MSEYMLHFLIMEIPAILVIQILVIRCIILHVMYYELKEKESGIIRKKSCVVNLICNVLEMMQFLED